MIDRELKAAIAVTRFGLGGRPGEIGQARSDPEGFLRAQIRPQGADLPDGNGETSAQRIADLRAFRETRRDAKAGDPKQDAEARDPVKMARRLLRDDTGGDFLARARLAATTDAGFRERWALFWANHFTVSATKLATATVVGPFETEAIRPHVFGRFEDLLVAAETHPAMLLYLDQAQSVGPDSRAAEALRRRQAQGGRQPGLNENLAREILELHTVGVGGGYTQADVTEFARALTGISIAGLRADTAAAGTAMFRDGAHEPGARTVMGVRYRDGGRDQAMAILADLARKPQTARFVCGKIARHFTADQPDPALTARLERSWTTSGGRLDKVAETLVSAPEAWDPAPAKFKTPYEFLTSSWRAGGGGPRDIQTLAGVLNGMGQKAFSAPSPKGWPEDAQNWAAPDAIVKRMTWAQGFAAAVAGDQDPRQLADQALGARLRPATATAIARAESRPEAFALLLMSPEFQRR
jgi:uncharacterized protein (DUF1800 family)